VLNSINLHNFRSYKKENFEFSPEVTLIIGKNTAGKSNLIEAIYFISHGKSFRTDKDTEAIRNGVNVAKIASETESDTLEVVLSTIPGKFGKKLLINGVSKRKIDFIGNLPSVLFSPQDLDLITGSPGLRRNFLDEVLEQTDRDYRFASINYSKALRQRNSLLEKVKNTGFKNFSEFSYWDNLLISNGNILTNKRQEFIDFVNDQKKKLFEFKMIYDESTISVERLAQYKEAEEASGLTLVGPHRDDFRLEIKSSFAKASDGQGMSVKNYGSRGQQRLSVLQLKLLQLDFLEKNLGARTTLLLDDIFSELDEGHILHVLSLVQSQQTIITTTHEEFIPQKLKRGLKIIQI